MWVKSTTPPVAMKVRPDCGSLTSRAGTALLVGVADRVGLTGALVVALSDLRGRRGSTSRDRSCAISGSWWPTVAMRSATWALCGTKRCSSAPWPPTPPPGDLSPPSTRSTWPKCVKPGPRPADACGSSPSPPSASSSTSTPPWSRRTPRRGSGGHLQGRLRLPPAPVLRGRKRRGPLRGSASRQRRLEHRLRPHRGARPRLAAVAHRKSQPRHPGTLRLGRSHARLHRRRGPGLPLLLVGFDLTEPVRSAILAVPGPAWVPALGREGKEQDGAWVCELDLDLASTGWPPGTRALCRRERPHPGAQLSFTDANGYRFQVFLTNQRGGRIARLEQIHRSRAAVEDAIRCAKASGLRNLPFRAFSHNAAWLEPRSSAAIWWPSPRTCSWTASLQSASPSSCATASSTLPGGSSPTRGASLCVCHKAGPGRTRWFGRSHGSRRCLPDSQPTQRRHESERVRRGGRQPARESAGSGPDPPSEPPGRPGKLPGGTGARTIPGIGRFGGPDGGLRGLMKDRG